ncbi:Preprotein translocase, SecG subunit [Candidatus Zixiibacteriota bacterium]|nr:Preprotein translocase, SecG subunit [candidate division Zixibacteria bacterium]
MFTLVVVFHTLVCILLVIVVLMQSAKGEGLAGAFGGGGGLTGAVFGGRGAASFLSKATTVLAVIFMINCGVLAYMSGHRAGRQVSGTESVVTREAAKEMERQAQQQQASPTTGGQQSPNDQAAPTQTQPPAGDGK